MAEIMVIANQVMVIRLLRKVMLDEQTFIFNFSSFFYFNLIF